MGETNMFTSGGRGLRRGLRFPLLERLPERRRVRFPLGSPRRNMRKAHLSSSLSLPLGDLPLSPPPSHTPFSLFHPPSLSLIVLPCFHSARSLLRVSSSPVTCTLSLPFPHRSPGLQAVLHPPSRSLKSRLLKRVAFLHMKSYFN